MVDIDFQPVRVFSKDGSYPDCVNFTRKGQLKTDGTKGSLTSTPNSGGCYEDVNAWIKNYVEGVGFTLVIDRPETDPLEIDCDARNCPNFLPVCVDTGC